MATRKSASTGMWRGLPSASRSGTTTPHCAFFPWQAWMRKTLGLLMRMEHLLPLNVLIISLMVRNFPSVPLTLPSSPWLRIQQMKASPCWGTSSRTLNPLPDHSWMLNSCSWEKSWGEAKNFRARSIWSLVWSLHISTLKPSQLNTSAKLSVKTENITFCPPTKQGNKVQ